MRNREEFKALVYSKRDKLLYEELEAKKKLNKRKKIYAVLSSTMAAVIVMAIVIPNAGKWMNTGNAPVADEAIDTESPDAGVYETAADKSEINSSLDNEAPADSEAAEEYEEPMETNAAVEYPEAVETEEVEYPGWVPAETAGETYYPEPGAPAEDVTPDASSPIQVKFTATLTTFGGESAVGNAGVVGSLDGEISDEVSEEILIITDYETLKIKFESLCSTTHAAAVFGGDEIFSEDRVILVIERFGDDPSRNEVAYQCVGVEDGTLYLVRKYIDRGGYDVPAVEVRCVDFVVLNKYGYDMSLIENIVITE